ncbi:type IV secretory system conjugative DNA transfer family protein [Paracraurococcus lichenis]|uniref:Type IV secretory system conjugative DNA transfer family protein n=1 Tax=Paracraurococcus lichenis TaxID=3064888 RepID=A0ABT9E9C3_9PROT|nr:type IV secretory system conjugative DNA transfer family protein [Paracraurococcus sp. LOR1-02]MDO9712807.1 type IV secretory system conjugative DNA transfer family protein [Paracraurococcus sp. LOR1-02]
MRYGLGTLLLAPAWLAMASVAFAGWTGRLPILGRSAAWCWLVFLAHGLGEGFWPGDRLALLLAALAATAGCGLLTLLLGLGRRPTIEVSRDGIARARGRTHGSAAFATERRAQERFPGVSGEGYGGIPVAWNYRRDLSRWAGVPFEPRRRETWDEAPKARMLVDPCTLRSTMSAWVAGSGVGKSQTLLQTLAHPEYRWRGSYVVGDPKGELEAMTRRTREAMGQLVYAIRPGEDGINVLAAIDPKGEDFELDVMTLAQRIAPEPDPGASVETSEWATWAQQIMWAMFAHMLAEPSWPADRRNLRTFKAGASCGEAELKQLLFGIAAYSPSKFARINARSVLLEAEDTWTGVYGTLQAHTAWLGATPLADMVSDDSLHPAAICTRPITVFVQAKPKALKAAPGVARVLYGALMGAAYDANGFIRGRILFDVDEAYTLGRMGIFELVRDLGRSYGITVRWWFQALGQLEVLYRQGTRAWYASLAYMAYAGVADTDTAKMISEYAGKFGAVVRNRSTNRGSATTGAFLRSTYSRGEGDSETEVHRQLLMEHEVLTMADNEVLFLSRGMPVIRACLPLSFQDESLRPHLDDNPLDAARLAWRSRRGNRRRLAA